MINITGTLMLEDREIAAVKNGEIVSCDEQMLPLYIRRTGNIEKWLASRAIDEHRVNSRLLKKALRIKAADDVETVLSVNAATITDRYWFKPEGSGLFICRLGESLGFPMAHYELDGSYIKSRNFTGETGCNFEPMAALTEDDDYSNCFDIICEMSEEFAMQYLRIIWMDTVC